MTKKMTKKEMFAKMLEKYAFTEEERTFIKHEIFLLEKKSSGERKMTKTQEANVGIKKVIMEVLTESETALTVTEIIKSHTELAELSNQKVSALITQLVTEKRVEKIVEKRKSYFKAV